MKSHFQSLAAYGAWVNDRLLSDAAVIILGVAEPKPLDILVKGFLEA
jgi:hypothetical protein